MASLDDKLSQLATLSPAQLRAEWRALYREEAPPLTPAMLRLSIGYRLQEKALGGVPRALHRELERIGAGIERGPSVAIAAARIKPGTRLVRDWGGESHHVLVEVNGFSYRDQQFGSLSEIARLITGTNWSGPRFFGLRQKARARG